MFAESTNGDVQRFKYNGKELDRKFGLNWYDHGARHNDAVIGRWHSIDKNAEQYYGISPYAYCGGDPVNFGDYDGMAIYEFDSIGELTIKPEETMDQIRVKGVDNTLTYAPGTITDLSTDNVTILAVNGDPLGTIIFEFLSDNTIVEFGQIKTGEETNGKNFVSTLGKKSLGKPEEPKKGPNKAVIDSKIINPRDIRVVNHSHPDGSMPSRNDYLFSEATEKKVGHHVSFNVYIPGFKYLNYHWTKRNEYNEGIILNEIDFIFQK